MSTMLLSLLIKVREEGAVAIARLRESLGKSAEGLQIARMSGMALGIGLRVGAYEARQLAGAIGHAGQQGRQLVGTLMHGTLGVAALAYGFKKGFLDISVEAEKMRGRLRAAEGTDGRAEAAMAWTKQFRDRTATTLGDVRGAWLELRNNAIRPTEFTLRAIADAAEGAGMTMSAAAKLFADVVEGRRLNKLDEFGIEMEKQGQALIFTYRHLGQTIRESVPKDNKLLVANKLAEILTKLRGGAAENASRGWAGLLLTMGESWKNFALEVMDKGGVFATLKSQLDDFIDGGKKNADGLADNARSLAGVLQELIRGGFAVATWLRDNLPTMIGYAKDFTAAIGGWKVVLGIVIALLAAPFVASLLGVLMALGPIASTIATILVPALFALATSIAAAVIPVIYSLGVALLTTPVGWIIMAIAALIAGAWLLYENWDQVVAALGQAWDWMKAKAADLWGQARQLAADAATGLLDAWSGVRAFFEDLWATIKRGFDFTFGAIAKGLAELKGMMPSLPSVALPSLSGAASSVGGWMRQTVDGAVNVVVEVTGDAKSRITGTRMSGPLDLDASLGQTMAMP
ncbi:MAG: hypothetical protein K2Y40_12795 [Reyranella sp.]|nr:hypothetical protein [Reyranella sp.]